MTLLPAAALAIGTGLASPLLIIDPFGRRHRIVMGKFFWSFGTVPPDWRGEGIEDIIRIGECIVVTPHPLLHKVRVFDCEGVETGQRFAVVAVSAISFAGDHICDVSVEDTITVRAFPCGVVTGTRKNAIGRTVVAYVPQLGNLGIPIRKSVETG